MNADENTQDAPVEVDRLVITNHLNANTFDAHEEKLGLLLSMAEQGLRAMIDDHGGDVASVRFAVERGTHDVTGERIVVIEMTADRPAGWTKPADHVGETGTEPV